MFKDKHELQTYVARNYPEVTDRRIDHDHWDLTCTTCKIVRGFQVVQTNIHGRSSSKYGFQQDFDTPLTYYFRCPVCQSFKQWIVYKLQFLERDEEGKGVWVDHYFRVASIPSEGMEDIDELPDDPPSLRLAYTQAVRSMDANAPLAAAANVPARDSNDYPRDIGSEARQLGK
jgi:hypothetical protein